MFYLTIASRWLWCASTATLYQALTTPLDLLGVITVPLAIRFGVHRRSRIYPTKTIFTAPSWLHWWGNEQEGYDPPWAVQSIYKGWPTFWRRYSWAAWRNKSSNKRFTLTTWLHQPPDPARIRFIPFGPGSWLCWQGWRTNWQWARRTSWTELGWRYSPSDVHGLPASDWRRFGCGVAFRPYGRH